MVLVISVRFWLGPLFLMIYNVYEIEWKRDPNYLDSYYCQTKNSRGQTIRCEVYRIDRGKRQFNFSFCIKQKRKLDFPHNQITGRDGIRSLLWAYECLKSAITLLKTLHPGSIIEVWGDSLRKQQIYKRYLMPLGFKVKQSQYKELYLNIE